MNSFPPTDKSPWPPHGARTDILAGWRSWAERGGLAGIYLFALFALLGTAPASIGLALFSLCFFLTFTQWSRLARDPVALVALAFGLYVIGHGLAAALTAPDPEWSEAAAEGAKDWLKLLLFIPFAYWAGGDPGRIRRLLLLALLGFTLGTLLEIDWTALNAAYFAERYDGRLPALAFGMFTGLGVLGLLACREAFWGPATDRPWVWTRRLLWFLLLAAMLEGLLLSYARGSWLAFLIAVLLLVFLEWRAGSFRLLMTGGRPGRKWFLALLMMLTLAIILGSQVEHIGQRLLTEREAIATLASGEATAVRSESVGRRIQAWILGTELWTEKPWLGWGPGSSPLLLARSERTELLDYRGVWLPHFHNTYLEILVQFGAIGFILLAALLAFLARGVRVRYRAGGVPGDLPRLFLVTLVFVLLWNFTNFRVPRHDWMAFWILFAGGAYSLVLRKIIAADPRTSQVDAGEAPGNKI